MAIRSLFQQGEHTVTSTGTVNDLSINDCGFVRLNNASDLTLTGLVAGVPGQVVCLVSVGAGNVFLSHDTGSSSVNRLLNVVTSGPTPLAAGLGLAIYQYDGTTQRWRLIQHEQGAPLTPAYSAGNFTASGTMAWTVASGDVSAYTYYIKGRLLFFNFQFDTTSITAPLSNQCRVAIPGGYTTTTATQGYCFILDNNNYKSGRFYIGSSTQVFMEIVPLANYLAATNTTYFGLQGQITIT